MPNTGMARQTIGGVIAILMANGGNQITMTIKAVPLGYPPVLVSNTDRFRKIAHRKGQAVIPAVNALDKVFGRKRVGRVTIVASGHRFVGAMIPAVIHLAHDMTIHARGRIIREIRSAFSISKGKGTQTNNAAEKTGKRQPEPQGDGRQSRPALDAFR